MEIGIVILNWNAAEDTINCVHSLRGWSNIEANILVVDNDSADDSVMQIQAACPEVELICSPENLGFAGGSNLGMRVILEQKEMPILLLNNDAAIEEESVVQLFGILQNEPEIGGVVPILYDEVSGKLISAGGKNPVKHMQTRVKEIDSNSQSTTIFAEVVSGTAVLFSPTMLTEAGLLDERFFFSTEVADICLRAQKLGYKFAVALGAGAHHSVERSSRFRDTLYVYYIIRNRFLILRNHYRLNLVLWGYWTIYSLALALKLRLDRKRPSARAVFMALKDGLMGRFGGQNERVMVYVEG